MAHPDLDELLNAALPFARKMLLKRGEFHPFGVSLSPTGVSTMAGVWDGREPPPATDVITELREVFREKAAGGGLKACAICFDARVVPPGATAKTDAIGVELEHESGEAVQVFLPYAKGWFGRIRYGELFASQGKRFAFARS